MALGETQRRRTWARTRTRRPDPAGRQIARPSSPSPSQWREEGRGGVPAGAGTAKLASRRPHRRLSRRPGASFEPYRQPGVRARRRGGARGLDPRQFRRTARPVGSFQDSASGAGGALTHPLAAACLRLSLCSRRRAGHRRRARTSAIHGTPGAGSHGVQRGPPGCLCAGRVDAPRVLAPQRAPAYRHA